MRTSYSVFRDLAAISASPNGYSPVPRPGQEKKNRAAKKKKTLTRNRDCLYNRGHARTIVTSRLVRGKPRLAAKTSGDDECQQKSHCSCDARASGVGGSSLRS